MGTLIRYASPLSSVASLLEDYFSDGFARADRDITNTTWPRVDIAENADSYVIKADLPGMSKEDIALTVENGVLTIRGEKKEERKESEKGRYYHYERTFGKFQRAFNLPEDVDADSIAAKYDNGILELSIRKVEKAKPKAIEITVN
jgi:HSP20 family protein